MAASCVQFVPILPRVDVEESASGDSDLVELEGFDDRVNCQVGERFVSPDGFAQGSSAGDKQQVLATAILVDGNGSVCTQPGKEGCNRFRDERVVAGEDEDAVSMDVWQRCSDACHRSAEWRILSHDENIQPRQAFWVARDDHTRCVSHRRQRVFEERLAAHLDCVLRGASQPARTPAGQHDRVVRLHASHTRVTNMVDDARPTWRTEPVSFTRRGGRLTDRQQAAWNALAGTHVIDVPRSGPNTSVDPAFQFDPAEAFGRSAPLVVEIGSGRGETLVAAAADAPEMNFLGLEVYIPGVAQTLVTMRHAGVENIRMAIVNAPEALRTMLPERSVHELRTWFPDPWHKGRHHKRRLITVPFTELVARVLEPGGVWRIATDWSDYAKRIAEVLAASPHITGGPSERFERPETRFERKGRQSGRTIHDFTASLG